MEDFFRLLRQRKALIAGLVLLVLLAAAVATALAPRWYRSTATVRVEKPDGEMQLFESRPGAYYDPYFLQDQFRIMQEPKILGPVIERLDLNRRIGAMLGAPAPLPADVTLGVLVGSMLRLESPRNSSLIKISVFAREPALAATIANEIAVVYAEDRIAFATSAQRESLARLREELAVQERNVTAQRDRVEQLRTELNLAGVDLNSRYIDMDVETLRQMQNSLIALRVDAIGRKTRWERFRAIPFDERINLINSELIADANIQNLLQAYLIADQTVTRLAARLGSAHPDLAAAVDNRAKIREQLDGQLRGYANALEIAHEDAASRVVELERQLDAAKGEQILSAGDRRRPFEEAVRYLEDETRLLTTLRLTLRQREIDFQVPKRSIEVLGEAEPARQPAKPNWTLNLLLAGGVGLLLGLATAALIEYLDRSFRGVAEVEERLGVPALGVIPRRARGAGLPEVDEPMEAEPFRVLQANLELALNTTDPRVVAMVSAGPGEGKSSTLHALARVMAAGGARVLVVDADMRRPTQHQLAGIPRGPGLGEVLAGEASFADAVRRELAPGLDVLPAGSHGSVGLARDTPERLRGFFEEWRQTYDRILIDCPPLIGVSDAATVASVVDGAILLVQYRRNPESMAMRAKQVLVAARAPLIGVVLNQIPPGAGGDYAYYTDNYAYYEELGRSGRRVKAAGRPSGSSKGEAEKLVLRDPPA